MSTAKFSALAVVAFACSLGFSAQAESTSPADPGAHPAKPTRDPNQVICKRENEPGSRLGGHQDCRTRADWEQVARDSKEATQAMQAKTNTGAGGH